MMALKESIRSLWDHGPLLVHDVKRLTRDDFPLGGHPQRGRRDHSILAVLARTSALTGLARAFVADRAPWRRR
jgi:hypothetical protein